MFRFLGFSNIIYDSRFPLSVIETILQKSRNSNLFHLELYYYKRLFTWSVLFTVSLLSKYMKCKSQINVNLYNCNGDDLTEKSEETLQTLFGQIYFTLKYASFYKNSGLLWELRRGKEVVILHRDMKDEDQLSVSFYPVFHNGVVFVFRQSLTSTHFTYKTECQKESNYKS